MPRKKFSPYNIPWSEILPDEKSILCQLISDKPEVRAKAFNVLWSNWGNDTEVGRPRYKMRLQAKKTFYKRKHSPTNSEIDDVIQEGWKTFLDKINQGQITISDNTVYILDGEGEKFSQWEPGFIYALIWKGVDTDIQKRVRNLNRQYLVQLVDEQDVEENERLSGLFNEISNASSKNHILPDDADQQIPLMRQTMAQASIDVFETMLDPGKEMTQYCIMWFFLHWSTDEIENFYQDVNRSRARDYKINFVRNSLTMLRNVKKRPDTIYMDVLVLLYESFLLQTKKGGRLWQSHGLPQELQKLVLPTYLHNPNCPTAITGFISHLQQYPHMNEEE